MTIGLFDSDLKGWLLDLLSFHPVPPMLGVFWTLLILSSLKGVDRRDDLAHVTYAITLMAFAVCFYFLAALAISRRVGPGEIVIVCATGAILAGVRWGLRREASALEFKEQKIEQNNK